MLNQPVDGREARVVRLTRDGLIAQYATFGKPASAWRVGAEFERHLLLTDGTPLTYDAPNGVRWMLDALARDGWRPVYEGANPIEVHRDGAAVTLEPGAQFELSGAPYADLDGVYDEAASFASLVDRLLAPTGARQVALGFTPFAAIPDIDWVPKGRYALMRDHLIQTGDLSHHMMKGTCAVQASYDFADEADCARKVALSTKIGPLTTAMFANSPVALGKVTNFQSYRGHIWTRTDPRRTGFPEVAEAFTFEAWVDYLLDVPMMFRKRNSQWEAANGRPFSAWMTDEVDPPTEADWELHLTSVFPEVRIKRTIEVRGADCVPLPLAMAFVALFKGLFYDDRALGEALEVAGDFSSHGSRENRFDVACREGLAGTLGGERLADWSARLVDLARGGLDRAYPGESRWLAPLVAQVASGVSPAAKVLAWHAAGADPAALGDLFPMGASREPHVTR